MKKVGRFSFRELEANFTVLSEEEQKQFVGGYHYYNHKGEFIMQAGGSDEIRVLSESEYNPLDPHIGRKLQTGSHGTSLSNSSGNRAIKKIVGDLANKIIGYNISGVGILINYGTASGAILGLTEDYGPVALVYNRNDLTNSMATLVNALHHESVHYQQYLSQGSLFDPEKTYTGVRNENEAYELQTSQPGFLSLPKAFREKVLDAWLTYCDQSVINKNRIKVKCGLPNHNSSGSYGYPGSL